MRRFAFISILGFLFGRFSQASRPAHKPLEVMGRKGYVYSPLSRTARAAVFVLHGSGGQPSDMFDLGFEAIADARGFYVVYPEMKVAKSDEWGYGEDIKYFEALAERLQQADFGVSKKKLFVCGHSAGGSMSLFLQNEMSQFEAAGVVEAGVGNLDGWNMTKLGHRTIVVWNHADPVLEQYAPGKVEKAYYNLTLRTLRRSARSEPDMIEALPTSKTVVEAARLTFIKNAVAPELQVVSWTSKPGRHAWALPRWTTSLDATKSLVDFFLGDSVEVVV